jgi:DNA polymerase III delta prime subunit
MELHKNINDILDNFILNKNIPNIIFHGPSGSGKSTIVKNFISKIYDYDKDKINTNVIEKNCAKSNGIRFIRDEIKMFVKTNISSNSVGFSKMVVLDHADELTDDAQSVLRRCIEVYNNTRFLIIIEDYSLLINPIISRFCSLHVPLPDINGKIVNLYEYNLEKPYSIIKPHYSRSRVLNRMIKTIDRDEISILNLSHKLYNLSYDSNDLISYIIDNYDNNLELYRTIIETKNKTNCIPNERYIIWYILNIILLRF